MISDKIVVPRFASESEEAEWWFENRETHGEIMAKAIEEGQTTNLRTILERRGQEMPRVSVEFDYDDVAQAGRQAAERGMELESYMRDLMHEAFTKNGAA